jgi:integrase
MKPEPLTPVRIRHIKPPQTGRLDIGDGATPGLCLRVSAHDSWKWTLRMRGPDGGLRRFVLGEFTDVHGLAWARREAEKLRQQVRHQGRDPHHERKERAAAAKAEAERDRLTLGVLVDDWSRLHLTKRSDRYASEAVRALRAAFAKQWGRPAGALDRATARLALDALERPEKAPKRRRGIVGNGRAIADRTCAYGRACFAWAMKREMVAANPFLALPKREAGEARERVLNDAELVAIWRAVAFTDAKVFGSIVRLLILTGQRREEVAGIAWPEISADQRTWTIPASRTKNGKPHLVPLSAAARDVLPEEPDAEHECDLVFPGQRGTPFNGWSKSKAQLDKDSGVTGWRIHDLRRTLATGLQRLGVRLEVTEAVLNHVSGSRAGIVGIYQRHEWASEKRTALDAWAEHVMALVQERSITDKVVVALHPAAGQR